MAKGGRESKMPGYGRLLISPFPIAGDWLKVAHNQAFLTPYHPLPYIFWTLWAWGFIGTPRSWGKNGPRNAWKQILLKFWAIVCHSVPPLPRQGPHLTSSSKWVGEPDYYVPGQIGNNVVDDCKREKIWSAKKFPPWFNNDDLCECRIDEFYFAQRP